MQPHLGRGNLQNTGSGASTGRTSTQELTRRRFPLPKVSAASHLLHYLSCFVLLPLKINQPVLITPHDHSALLMVRCLIEGGSRFFFFYSSMVRLLILTGWWWGGGGIGWGVGDWVGWRALKLLTGACMNKCSSPLSHCTTIPFGS